MKRILEIFCLIGSVAIIVLSMVCIAITGECEVLYLLLGIAGTLLGWAFWERIRKGK